MSITVWLIVIGVIVVILVLLKVLSRNDEKSATRFLFTIRGLPDAEGQFVAITSDLDVISRVRTQLELPEAERNMHINGAIARGNGGHNLNWSWHFVPDEWDLAEISAEICDGTPQMVEDDLDYWVDTVERFCPWNSYVVRELGGALTNDL